MSKKHWQWIAISLTTMLSVMLTIHLNLQSPAFAQNPITPIPTPTSTPSANADLKPNQSLRVVTRLIKPFVYEEGTELVGFSMEFCVMLPLN